MLKPPSLSSNPPPAVELFPVIFPLFRLPAFYQNPHVVFWKHQGWSIQYAYQEQMNDYLNKLWNKQEDNHQLQ